MTLDAMLTPPEPEPRPSRTVTFTVPGLPIPQGSLRAFARRGGGRPIVTGDNPRTRPWKSAVTAAAAAAAYAIRSAIDERRWQSDRLIELLGIER